MKKQLPPPLLITAAAAWILIGTWALANDHQPYLPAMRFAGVVLFIDSLILGAVAYSCHTGTKERDWIIAEASASGLFSVVLLLDPVFTMYVFPFIVTPWIVAKGLTTALGAISLRKNIHGWVGDLAGGLLLISCGLLFSTDPLINPSGINLLIGTIGWTIGLLYLYDAYRFGKINPTFHEAPMAKTA
jgi:uncharacterized membrane protein HdeD (DUF308 family)